MGIEERILQAGQDLARVKGFYNMNMDELAQQAGVSKRTVYRYFRSKEEIVEACLNTFAAEMAAEMDKTISQDIPAAEMIAAVMQNLINHGQFIINPLVLNDLRVHYPQLWKKLDAFRMEKASYAITRYIQQSDKPDLQGIDPLILTSIILASIQAVINPDFILDNGFSFEYTARQIGEFFTICFS